MGVTVAVGEAGGTAVAAGVGVDVRVAVADGAASADGVDGAVALGVTGVSAEDAPVAATTSFLTSEVADGAGIVVTVGPSDGVRASATPASCAVAPGETTPGALSGPLQPAASSPASRTVRRMPPVPEPDEFMSP